jgi:hypothetical protein
MNASAWIALASIAGFVLLQTTVIAFAMGRLFQRVSTVEKGHDSLATMGSDVAEMKSDIRHMAKAIDDLTARLAWVTEATPVRPRASRQRVAV